MTAEVRGHRVVVLGAGYAGLPAASRLARQVSRYGVRVVLVNASPQFVERPRLHQVAAGQPAAELPLAPVTGIDLDRATVRMRAEARCRCGGR